MESVQLTSYDQSQSAGYDTHIGQQIQEHDKLRERAERECDLITFNDVLFVCFL